ncbi:hypothetical protein AK812_SmicGene21278 [Symbiodinium microadriaticum]|uniref:Uncharacterized protein n=1 Tax=Symbiodinium microadriaticum TaxID=2951 RepID=A0A1Q9DMT2_SYMMI|nr:hypothetical protein AK812_SmicGene21278 [Symbiodinium microadriaticum]CAE7904395.1 unnamed protein product [Symbiodinium microadriaticum]CAE7906616.1 unnamed protein product [Symbiodinium sp. KB8]
MAWYSWEVSRDRVQEIMAEMYPEHWSTMARLKVPDAVSELPHVRAAVFPYEVLKTFRDALPDFLCHMSSAMALTLARAFPVEVLEQVLRYSLFGRALGLVMSVAHGLEKRAATRCSGVLPSSGVTAAIAAGETASLFPASAAGGSRRKLKKQKRRELKAKVKAFRQRGLWLSFGAAML